MHAAVTLVDHPTDPWEVLQAQSYCMLLNVFFAQQLHMCLCMAVTLCTHQHPRWRCYKHSRVTRLACSLHNSSCTFGCAWL